MQTHTWDEPPDYAPWPAKGHWPSVDGPATQHLPDDVVANEFSLIVVARTTKENPRAGSIQVAFKFGDRINPTDLTPDEADYLTEVLRVAIRQVSA